MQTSGAEAGKVAAKAAGIMELCRWCVKAPRRNADSDLCAGCARCAQPDCGRTDGPFKVHAKAIYCDPHGTALFEAQSAAHDAADLEKRLKAAGFYPRHKDATLERLHADQRDVARRYLAEPSGTFIVSGTAGTGKTWTGVAIARELIRRGGTARWHSVPWMFASIRDWMAEKGGRNEFRLTDFVDDLLSYDHIVLDDLGAHRATDWAVETLYLVLERWELLDKPGGLIVTTNLDLETISATFGDRIASRLAKGCKIAPMEGVDRRVAAARRPA